MHARKNIAKNKMYKANSTKQRPLLCNHYNLKSCPPSLLLLRGKEGMIHLLVETHVKKPDSGFLSDTSRNNTYESMCSDWPFNNRAVSGSKLST